MTAPAMRVTRWWPLPAIVFIVGLGLTLALWQHSVEQFQRQREADFVARGAAIQTVVLQRLGVYSQALQSSVALFDAGGDVSRESWRRFIASLRVQENYPGMLALAYARYVDDSELALVTEQAHRDGIAEYALRPPGERGHYVVNLYVEPFNDNTRKALGYDMYQDAERHRVMDLARDAAAPRITAKVGIKIDAEPNPRPAFIMYLPVYRGGTPATQALRREQLMGFVLCPFRMPELMQAVFREPINDIGFALYDGTVEDEAHLLYQNAAFGSVHAPRLQQRREIEFAGRRWTMVTVSTPGFEESPGRYWPELVLGIGLAATLTAAAMLLFMALARRRAVSIATEMTHSLRSSQAKWQSLFSQSPLGVMLLDRDGIIIDCNDALCEVAGVSREAMIGFNEMADANDNTLKPWLLRALAGECVKFETYYRPTVAKNAGYYRFYFQPIEQDGDFSMLLCFVEDISEQHSAAERIFTLAHQDSLTGLDNRLVLNERLNHALLESERLGMRLAVLFLDLDHFKTINDSLGHTHGDTILVEMAQRLRSALRPNDTLARLGGDEFVIVLRDVESIAAVTLIAENLLRAITAQLTLTEHNLNVTSSMGIALFPDDGADADTLIKNADAAMYHAKETGRNQFQFFKQDINTRIVDALAMEAALRQALRDHEFLLYYQPQVTLKDGAMIGVEALIRWQRPDVGMVPPNRFIPFAESRGLICAIGDWVLNEACRQNRQWQDQGLPAMPIAVNISTLQLRDGALVGVVRQALERSGLEPRYLELEITESALAHNLEFAIELIHQLKALGVNISVDDFGIGYSSLSYLKRFPIDKLKIDQTFVRDIISDKDDAVLTQTIIAMGKNLGMKVLAEGVETHEQLDFLHQHNCDEAQGYLFSRPLPADAFAEFVASYHHERVVGV